METVCAGTRGRKGFGSLLLYNLKSQMKDILVSSFNVTEAMRAMEKNCEKSYI